MAETTPLGRKLERGTRLPASFGLHSERRGLCPRPSLRPPEAPHGQRAQHGERQSTEGQHQPPKQSANFAGMQRIELFRHRLLVQRAIGRVDGDRPALLAQIAAAVGRPFEILPHAQCQTVVRKLQAAKLGIGKDPPTLAQQRGGIRLPGGIDVSLSIDTVTALDGSVVLQTVTRIAEGAPVVAARARFGTILGSTVDQIAPSRRFYAGGGASVRGYGYQAIGPRYGEDDDPVGGKSLAEFSLEGRIRFGNFGVVPFVDAGNISTSFLPRFRDLRVGAGLGVRYYSNFGPIRVDVGTPINPQSGDPKIAVYVSLGQAF